MKRMLSILLCGALLLSGCVADNKVKEETDSAYKLYFLMDDLDSVAGDGALQTETVYLPEQTDIQQEAQALLQELLKGPLGEGLTNAIPLGTTLEKLAIRGNQAVVDLSGSYSTLSGVALTLADYAITLTLTQIPEIVSVRITVDGAGLAYREKQSFASWEVLLAPQGDVVGTVDATLYFLNNSGYLKGEERVLELYEGDTQVSAVVRALENGSENKELRSVLPESFRLRSVWLEENTCYVNLSSAMLGSLSGEVPLNMTVRALGRSLCSLEAVAEVRFLVDGEFAQSYGSVNIEEPFVD